MICEYGIYGDLAAGALVAVVGIDNLTSLPPAVHWGLGAYAADAYCRGVQTDMSAARSMLWGMAGGYLVRMVM